MTIMPIPPSRDPRRRYRANKLRSIRRAVPPIVVPQALIEELALVSGAIRTRALQALERQHGAPYVQAVLAALVPYMKKRNRS
jgi:hypothetical protein